MTADPARSYGKHFRVTGAARASASTRAWARASENEEWMAVHIDKTIQRRKNYDNRAALAEEEEQILKCLGAAVLMRWNETPTGALRLRQ